MCINFRITTKETNDLFVIICHEIIVFEEKKLGSSFFHAYCRCLGG